MIAFGKKAALEDNMQERRRSRGIAVIYSQMEATREFICYCAILVSSDLSLIYMSIDPHHEGAFCYLKRSQFLLGVPRPVRRHLFLWRLLSWTLAYALDVPRWMGGRAPRLLEWVSKSRLILYWFNMTILLQACLWPAQPWDEYSLRPVRSNSRWKPWGWNVSRSPRSSASTRSAGVDSSLRR